MKFKLNLSIADQARPTGRRAIGAIAWRASFGVALVAAMGAGGCPSGGLAPAPPPTGLFSFTSSTSSVNIPQNTLSSEVEFRVTSNGTFEGQVVVHWAATGDCTPSPDTNDVTVSVTPTAPGVFKRKMYRWSDTGRNLHWTATHAATNTTKSLDIAFTH